MAANSWKLLVNYSFFRLAQSKLLLVRSSPSMTKVLKNNPLPVQIEGLPYIFAGLILTVSAFLVWRSFQMQEGSSAAIWTATIATFVFSLFTVFSIWFYRNPERVTPQDDREAVISPADGTVLKIEEITGQKIGESKAKKVSIFMSPMDVHVNRAPVDGTVEAIDYVKGKFFKADLDKASEENEHNWVVMKSVQGPKVAFVQIAGFVARRIVCYVEKGERLQRGERFGMIRFGSRMEIVVPETSEILVKPGDKTLAGLTKLARLKVR